MTIVQLSYLSTKYDELGWGLTDKDFVDNASDYFERHHAEYYMYIGLFTLDPKMRTGNENILCPLLSNIVKFAHFQHVNHKRVYRSQ